MTAQLFEVRSEDGLEAVFRDAHTAEQYAAELRADGHRRVQVCPVACHHYED